MVRFSLRIPKELHGRLRVSAEADRRSINEQILWILEQHLGRGGNVKVTWQVIEDNGGGLHLAVFEGGRVIYYYHGYQAMGSGALLHDIEALLAGDHPIDDGWEVPADIDDPQAAYDELTSHPTPSGWQVVADQDGTYYERMGAAAERIFGDGATYQAWLDEMLMGEGPTREAAIEAAVNEYEGQFAEGAAYDGHPGFDSKQAFLAALEVSVKEDD